LRLYIYAVCIILFSITLNASDINSSISSSDNNISIDKKNITAKSWFYYREFINHTQQLYEHHVLSHIDKAYLYGTDAVIVVGSGIDYTLFRLLSNYDRSQLQLDANVTHNQEAKVKDEKNFFKDGFSNETSEKLEQYLLSQKGKLELPQQLYSPDKRKGERTYLISGWFGDKNINDDFLDRTNRSYIRLRGGYAYNYRGDDEYIYSITARLKIPRTREKLDLIIGDDTKNSTDLSLEGTEAERDSSIALGLNNPFELLSPVDARVRLGFSGITNPYAKTTFNYEALFGRWMIVPHQAFRYSAEEKFEEWTNLDFRRRIASQMMLSLLFQRSTISDIDGMNYFAQPSLNFTLGKYGNFTPYLGMYGRTQEQPIEADGYTPKRGVYRYAVGLNWSRQASRRYIVYRLQPILSYDDPNDFRPNYFIKALLEFYFGLRD